MGIRKFRLLMSKYGFSIAIILIELVLVFGIILYMSQIAPIIWVKIGLAALTVFITYYLFWVIPDKK